MTDAVLFRVLVLYAQTLGHARASGYGRGLGCCNRSRSLPLGFDTSKYGIWTTQPAED